MDAMLLAHAGESAGWQSVVTGSAIGLAIVWVGVLAGVIKMSRGSDLMLPLASVLMVASLGVTSSDTLSDWIGWSLPLAIVSLVMLVLHALQKFTPTVGEQTEEGWRAGSMRQVLTALAVPVIALGLIITFEEPLRIVLHPYEVDPADIPFAPNARIAISSPQDGDALLPGETSVDVTVTGATLGPPVGGQLPNGDLTRGASVRVFVDTELFTAEIDASCAGQLCTTVSVPVVVEPGATQIVAELITADGRVFFPPVDARIDITVE